MYGCTRTVRRARTWQWTGRKAARLGPGTIRRAHGGRGAPVDRRLVPEHQLHAEQERDMEREHRLPRAPWRGVRGDDRSRRGRHGEGSPAQARHGRPAGRRAPARLQGQRRRADHGERAFRRSENTRGTSERRGGACPPRGQGLRQRRHTRDHSHRSRPGSFGPAHQHRSAGIRPRAAHLVVLGGGYVGLEFSQAYRRFGSRVTIIQQGPQLLSQEDPDISSEVQRILSTEGIECLLGAQTLRVHGRSGKDVTVLARTAAGEQRIEGSDILVAVGRTPNTTGIGLETAGVELDARGYVRVNDQLETTAPDVWAIGECAGTPHFTHASVDDFRIIKDNLAGGNRNTRDRLIPYCMFTDPPLAHVGLSERDAHRQGVAAVVAKPSMGGVLRVQAVDARPGLMKVLISASDDRILGFTMIGPEAGEVMAAVQAAMLAELPYPKLRDAVLAHLTMAEGLGALLSNVPPLAQCAASR